MGTFIDNDNVAHKAEARQVQMIDRITLFTITTIPTCARAARAACTARGSPSPSSCARAVHLQLIQR